MKKTEKIILAYSCHEDLEKMNSVGNDKLHCSQCSKNISDFRKVENQKISTLGCGIFNPNQVQSIQRKNIINSLSKPISIATLLGVTLLPLNLTAQEIPKEKMHQSQNVFFNLSGKIIDQETTETLPFVNICLLYKDSVIDATSTEFNGIFQLKIDTNTYPLQNLSLAISYVGYDSDTVTVKNKENVIIELESGIDVSSFQILKGYPVPLQEDDTLPNTKKSREKSKRSNRKK